MRITIDQKDQSGQATVITLEGRVAGPFAAELGRVWTERAPQLARRKLSLDLSNVIYADADGIVVLRAIYLEARPELLAMTPWTRHLAEQIANPPHDVSSHESFHKEQGDANN